MCLIISKQSGTNLPDEQNLINGFRRNSDGIGIAWRKKNEKIVNIKKDFKDVDNLIKFLKENISIEDDLIVHFRLASSGIKDEGNAHPFPITKNKELLRKTNLQCKQALAHNGTLSEYSNDELYSDTQLFITEILADPLIKCHLNNKTIKKLVDKAVGHGRMVILNSEGDFTYLGQGEWTKDEKDGCLYSNTLYKDTWRSYYDDFWGRKEWKNYNYYTPKKSNYTNKDFLFISECEYCGKVKPLKSVEVNLQTFLLCKKCRKKARKGKLFQEKNDNKEMVMCASCRKEVPEKEIVKWYGYDVCSECLKSLEEI